MDLNEMAAALGASPEQRELLELNWEDSVNSLPSGKLPFTDPEALAENARFCGLDVELLPLLEETAAAVEADPILRLYAWHFHNCLYIYPPRGYKLGAWPVPDALPGGDAGMLGLLVGVALVPETRKRHAEMEIPEEITRATCLQVRDFCNNHQVGRDGRPGILFSQIYWLRNIRDMILFRLGRFEFILKPATDIKHHAQRFLRARVSREVAILAAPGMDIDANGFWVGENEGKGEWVTTLEEDDDALYGYPCLPHGRILQEKVVMSKETYGPLFLDADYWLEMHIPSGGGMTPEICEDSFIEAFSFFDHFFPRKRARAFISGSWIFSPRLESIVPGSNLVSLLEEVYIYETIGNNNGALSHIFYREYDDWSQAPRDTRLQRGVLDLQAQGIAVGSARILLFRDDLPNYGEKVYRNMKWLTGLRADI